MPASESDDRVGKIVVDAAFQVHKKLGPGLLEKAYEACLAYELSSRGLVVARQVVVPIVYGDVCLDEGFRLDLLVDDSVVLELKAAEKTSALWQAQLISYLRLANKQLGFLINFNTPNIQAGHSKIFTLKVFDSLVLLVTWWQKKLHTNIQLTTGSYKDDEKDQPHRDRREKSGKLNPFLS